MVYGLGTCKSVLGPRLILTTHPRLILTTHPRLILTTHPRTQVASCDPFVKIHVAQQTQHSTVRKGTLYPEFDEGFVFYIDKDNPRRRHVKRDLVQCQKRPSTVSKET